jgi:hypothetical protein
MILGFLSLLGILSLVFLSGCGLLESRKKTRIEEVPPYYQHGKINSELRSYHDRECENMTNQVHIVRNREMERLIKSGEEEQQEQQEQQQQQQENGIKTTQEKKEKFWDKFKINDKNFLRSDEAVRISSNLDR